MHSTFAAGQSWKEKVRLALKGLLYISESEAPLFLLDDVPFDDLEGIQKFIQDDSNANAGRQTVYSPGRFLSELHRMADPNDAVLQANAQGFDRLFEILKEGESQINVIRVNEPQNQIYIFANGRLGSVLIRTEFVET